MNDADVLRTFIEPPLPAPTVDIDRAMRAGRRHQRTRRAALAVILVSVVAAGTFATLPVLHRGDHAADGRHTQLTITATAAGGGVVSVADLQSAATIVQSRLRASRFAGATVSVVDGHLIAVIRGVHAMEEIAKELVPGALTIRKVLNTVTPPDDASPVVADGEQPSRTQVLEKLGSAVTAAEAITDQTAAIGSPALEPFRHLSPAEVAVLPATMQFLVPQIGCRTLNARPSNSVAHEPGPVVACDTDGVKHLMDSTNLSEADLASAVARPDDMADWWKVELRFNANGIPKWTALTTEAHQNTASACLVTSPRVDGGTGVCQVAFVFDNQVLAAPAIQAILTDWAEITGSGGETQTTLLAAALNYGRLPVTLTIQNVTTT